MEDRRALANGDAKHDAKQSTQSMQSTQNTLAAERIAACAAELAAGGSIEMSPEHAADAPAIAALLPAGTRVYVHHLPRNGLAATLEAMRALRAVGLEPVPHIAARRLAS